MMSCRDNYLLILLLTSTFGVHLNPLDPLDPLDPLNPLNPLNSLDFCTSTLWLWAALSLATTNDGLIMALIGFGNDFSNAVNQG